MTINDPNAKIFTGTSTSISAGYTTTSATGISISPPYTSVQWVSPNTTFPDTISAKDVIIDGISLHDTLKTIQERLNILVPNSEKLDKYSALKELYQQYKTLEALIGEDNMPKKE